MSARGSSIGANDLTRAPHHAPVTRRDSFQLAGQPSSPVTRSHSLGARNESASFLPSFAEIVTSIGLVFALFVLLFVQL